LAEGPGFEPRLAESESAVLPLNYPPPAPRKKVTRSAKTGVRLRQVETKRMQLHAHAADDADAFAEIDLRVAGRMDERDEDLARSGAGDPHVILQTV
jgi:hypothetical protein